MSSVLQYHYLGSTRDLCSVLNDIFGVEIVQCEANNLELGTLQVREILFFGKKNQFFGKNVTFFGAKKCNFFKALYVQMYNNLLHY